MFCSGQEFVIYEPPIFAKIITSKVFVSSLDKEIHEIVPKDVKEKYCLTFLFYVLKLQQIVNIVFKGCVGCVVGYPQFKPTYERIGKCAVDIYGNVAIILDFDIFIKEYLPNYYKLFKYVLNRLKTMNVKEVYVENYEPDSVFRQYLRNVLIMLKFEPYNNRYLVKKLFHF